MTDERFSRFAVAAPHSLASESGRAVMAEGGNAIEAMIAMAATIAVVYPHMNSLGGDGFWTIAAKGRVRGIEACGPAGSLATIARYRRDGLEAIPPRGPQAALTVPGAVGGWGVALDMAQALGGRLPLDLLLGDAVRLAREGFPVSPSQARNKPSELEALMAAPGFAATYTSEGKLLPAGATLRLPALAAVIEQLGRAGFRDFYRGDVGREIAADLGEIGSPVTRADLETYRAIERAPLEAGIRAGRLFNSQPPTQGLASLIILGVFDRLGVTQSEGFDHVHGIVEATKRAIVARNRVVTDFDRLREDPAELLTPAALAREAEAIDTARAAPYGAATPKGDTIWMGAIDASGLAVSYIQSIYWEYGSGCQLRRTGLLMQNRGLAFSLDPAALNPLEPGRRPFHTLNPPIALLRDGRVMSYGAMGGDGQPQYQAQIFTRHVHFGQSLSQAIDAPRWLLGRTWGRARIDLAMENRFDDTLIKALARAGHEARVVELPYDDEFGHAGALVRYPDGSIAAAHDPRADGGAKGG